MNLNFKLLFAGIVISVLLSVFLSSLGHNVFFGALILPFFLRSK